MTFGSLSLLEQFRPIEGYATTAAVATTYSADLIACMALLVAMDGTGSERLEYSKINSLRALERLREKVCFVTHANRLYWNQRGDPRIMALLDRMIRAVPFDGREQSFHPKVILARQQGKGQPDRYVLSVGSRNLTSSSAWDVGVGLVGFVRSSLPAGHRRLAGLKPFVQAVGDLIKDPSLRQPFGELDGVAWELPAGIERADFRFHDGTPRGFAGTALGQLPGRGQVLLISPFLSPSMIQNVARHFADADEIRVVAGRIGWDKCCRSGARKCLKSEGGPLDPYTMEIASDDPPTASHESDDADAVDSESAPEGLRLHAKVYSVINRSRSHLIVGSANLTHSAWLNKNWEAFLSLEGTPGCAEALREWAEAHAQMYRASDTHLLDSNVEDRIDGLRNALAVANLCLEDRQDDSSRLSCAQIPRLLAQTECHLQVARVTAPNQWAKWDTQAVTVLLPQCDPSERSSFILMRATYAGSEAIWVQCVNLDPPLLPERDQAAFVKILGVDDFLRYLQSLLDESGDNSDSEDDGRKRRKGHDGQRGDLSSNPFRLETLLRRLARDSDSLTELDETVKRYRDLFNRTSIRNDERDRLNGFMAVWGAITNGMRMP